MLVGTKKQKNKNKNQVKIISMREVLSSEMPQVAI